MNREELREALAEALYQHAPDAVTDLDLADALIDDGLVGDLLAEVERLRATLDALRELADQNWDWKSVRALHGALRLILNGADGGDRDE